jgi:hypothetical protein
MPPAISRSRRIGEDFEVLAAGGPYDLTSRSGKPQRCIRRLMCPNATTISLMKNTAGVDSPIGAVPAGTTIDADVSALTVDATVMVVW